MAPASVMAVAARHLAGDSRKIGVDHLAYQRLEAGGGRPAEVPPRLRGIADHFVNLSRTEIARVEGDPHSAGGPVDSSLVATGRLTIQENAGTCEGASSEHEEGGGLP